MQSLLLFDSCFGAASLLARLPTVPSTWKGVRLVADFSVNPLGVLPPAEHEGGDGVPVTAIPPSSLDRIFRVLQSWDGIAAEVAAAEGDETSLLTVLGCNTASVGHAALSDSQRGRLPRLRRSMVSLVRDSLAAIPAQPGQRLGVMATQFTVASGRYQEMLARWDGAAPATTVGGLAATRTEAVVASLRHGTADGRSTILDESGSFCANHDAVILGCTCFPLALDVLQPAAPTTRFIDPAEAWYREVNELAATHGSVDQVPLHVTIRAGSAAHAPSVEQVEAQWTQLFGPRMSMGSCVRV